MPRRELEMNRNKQEFSRNKLERPEMATYYQR